MNKLACKFLILVGASSAICFADTSTGAKAPSVGKDTVEFSSKFFVPGASGDQGGRQNHVLTLSTCEFGSNTVCSAYLNQTFKAEGHEYNLQLQFYRFYDSNGVGKDGTYTQGGVSINTEGQPSVIVEVRSHYLTGNPLDVSTFQAIYPTPRGNFSAFFEIAPLKKNPTESAD
jgi:hypothetical protein